MKYLRILNRQIADAFKSVFRNLSLSFASVSCISITLILVGVSLIMHYNIENFSSQIEDTMTISVFVEREADAGSIETLQYELEKIGNIANIEYISKDQIKENLSGESTILGQVISSWDETTNPLQDEFIVSVEDIESIGKTAQSIELLDKVDLVKYGEGMIENLVSTFNVVKKIMVITVIALIIVTGFLISNTIKITINSRRREIGIRRLVGASNHYIKMPFFYEGIILGLLGSIVPIIICGYGYMFVYQKLEGNLFTPIINLVLPNQIMLEIISLILIISVLVGSFGSYRAVKRYLKV